MNIGGPRGKPQVSIGRNLAPQLEPAGADDLRDRTCRIVADDPVDAAQLADDALAFPRGVGAGGASQVLPVRHVHEAEIGKRRHKRARESLKDGGEWSV
jgi:hypothetical protein